MIHGWAVGDLWVTHYQKPPPTTSRRLKRYEENLVLLRFTVHRKTGLNMHPLFRDQEASSSNLDTPTSSAKSEPSGNLRDWGCVRICHSVLNVSLAPVAGESPPGFAFPRKGLQGISLQVAKCHHLAMLAQTSILCLDIQTRCLLLVGASHQRPRSGRFAARQRRSKGVQGERLPHDFRKKV